MTFAGLVQQLAVVVAAIVAVAVVVAIDRPDGEWRETLRSRFLFGLPVGTLVSVGLVLGVYAFVQGGIHDWNDPVTLPFRAWSYFYPLGILTAGFAHASEGHLMGNLLSTLVLGSLAEYAWGHRPRRREPGSLAARLAEARASTPLDRPLSNPYVRAFVVFPGAVVAAGVLTGLFALGPVIGFSGVVFALGGFALVHYPLGTLVALWATSLLRLVRLAFLNPQLQASARWVFETPWWARSAIQGHALGLFVGVLAGLYVLRRRGDRPPALRLFAGALLFGVAQSLWAVYWFRGGETFVLFRAVGLALVVLLAVLIAAAGAAPARPLSRSLAVPDPETLSGSIRSVSPAGIAIVALVFVAAAIAGPGVVPNLSTTDGEPLPGDPIEIDDYQVTYAENVDDGMVSVVEVELFGETTAVETSGVIVKSDERHIWTTAVSKRELAGAGSAEVTVGGVGWRETVGVSRSGWRVLGNDTVYRVTVEHDGDRRTAYLSGPSRADATIDGRNVSLVADEEGFLVSVNGTGDPATARLPAENGTVEAGGLRFVREGETLYVERGDTRVPIATEEKPLGSTGRR